MAVNPVFTVIVHAYNRPALLKQAVEALRGQTYPHLEIILINNGATPETIEYLYEVESQDKRVNLIHFEENQYSPGDPLKMIDVCWNAALRGATGDYVWAQEDDDLIADDYVEKMVALFQDNPECTSAAGLMVGIDEAGNRIGSGPRVSNFRSRYMPGHLLALDYLRGGKTIFAAPGTVFSFKRDVLSAAGGFHRSIVLCQLYGIVPFGVTGYDETALCYWRYHPEALNRLLSARGWIGIKEDLAMVNEWDIQGRWQIFGGDVAREVVTRIRANTCQNAANWFLINLYLGRFRSSLRILANLWTHRHFWLSIPHYARQGHPTRRWLRPIARQMFRLWPGLANKSPRLATLRDRVNR